MTQGKVPLSKRPIWRVVRWVPLTLMIAVAVGLLVMMLLGGMPKVAAWSMLQLLPPLLGLVFLVVVVLYAIIRRRLSRPVITTGLVPLLSITLALLPILPVAYPASLASMTPSATVRLPANVPLKVGWGGDRLAVNRHVIVAELPS